MKQTTQRFSLSQKFFIFLLLTSILPLILIVASAYWVGRTIINNGISSANQSLVCSYAYLVQQDAGQIEQLMGRLSNPSLLSLSTLTLEESIQQIQTEMGLEHAVIFYSLEGELFSPNSAVASFPYAGKINAWASTTVSPQEIEWQSDDTDLLAMQSLADSSDPKNNFILIQYPLNEINVKLKDLPDSFGYAVLLPDQTVLFQKQAQNGLLNIKNLPTFLPAAGSQQGDQHTLYICTNDLQWRFILVEPDLFVQSFTSNLSAILILVGLVTISLIGLSAAFIRRQFIGPIQKIVTKLESVDDEQNVYPEPLDDSMLKNEAKTLVSGFNQFIDQLRLKNRRENALRESEERYSLAIQGANDGIWDWDLVKNFCYFSQRWRYMLGYTQESVHNTISEWFTRVHPDDITNLKADINAHLEHQTPHFENEHRIRHANGTFIWVLARGLAIFNQEDKAIRFAGSITDISEQKAYEARLLHDAMHDPLTNIPNRAYFTQILENALSRTLRREDYHAAVLYLDLDRFKLINDSLGHQVGDQVLLETTQRLRRCLRSMDTISRFGGDEFAILLEEINGLQDAIHIARRILQEVNQPIPIPGQQDLVSNTSIGIVLITRGYQNSEEILRDADTAMYQAKAQGRGRFEVFDKEMHAYTLNKLRMEGELRRAMNNKEFKVFYQPIIDPGSGSIRFVEALLRWQHPEKGLINTEAFIPLAEESGLIRALNKWVLHNACAEAQQWANNGFSALIVSVNISPILLTSPDLGDIVRGALSDYSLEPEALQLEITESAGIYNSGIAIQNLYDLTSIGVKICLDDYGLVASSLEQLKRLPIYGIKIAQNFIKDLPANSDDAAISSAIIAMAHILGMQVFGEGIENQQQMDYLIEKGCNFLQGFWFTQPLHRTDFLNKMISFGTQIKGWDSKN